MIKKNGGTENLKLQPDSGNKVIEIILD